MGNLDDAGNPRPPRKVPYPPVSPCTMFAMTAGTET